MHPEIRQDHPGNCPICGMALEPMDPTVSDTSEYESMKKRFGVAAILTILVLFTPIWLQFVFSTIVVLWAGLPFFKRAYESIVNRSLNMFTLIAMGVGAAYLYSVVAFILPPLFVYFEAASAITTLVLLGQVLELKAKSQTNQAIRALLEKGAKLAHLIEGDQEREVSVEEVKVGDHLRVKPGEKVPVDGKILEGTALIDEGMVTGESLPVEKKTGHSVTGSTQNLNTSFMMEAKKVGQDTLLSRIIQMVAEAERSKAPIQKLADTVSGYFVPIVILIAFITFIVWAFFGPEPRFTYALINAVAVLIIACPCALGLATPMSIMVGVGKGAEMGILIKNGEALERIEKVNTIIVDKTGTLTEGKPKVTKIVSTLPENELLKWAAAVEKNSEHSLSIAIIEEAKEKKLPIPKVEDFQTMTGHGISGIVEGKKVLIGNFQNVKGFKEFENQAKAFQELAQTAIFVTIDGEAKGFIVVSDPIKESTFTAIKDLHSLNLKIIMVTGDNPHTAEAVAKKLHIDQFFASVMPEDKKRIVEKLQESCVVAVAGDGINDSPALAIADVGIAMGTGTDVAIESAPVTLVKGDLNGIKKAIFLGHATMKNIRQNLFFAFIYNILGIPIAAGILYPFTGLTLNPILASAAMAFSSVSVILNALRLKKVKF
jgi:Cu+-exporting ATPase